MKIKFTLDEIKKESEYKNGLEEIITLKSSDKFFVVGEYAMRNVAVCIDYK